MSEVIKSIILGIVQGLTEFLPVSSSGHLEIAKYLLETDFSGEESLMMTVVLHAATMLSTVFVFRKEILDIIKGLFTRSCNDQKRFAWFVVLSMIPAGLIGYFFESGLSALFDGQVVFVAFMLMVTALLLLIADRAKNLQKPLNSGRAFGVGIAQAIALLPGVSRSGATISGALLLGLDRKQAAVFSFLMVVPLIIGKVSKDIMDGTLASSEISVSVLSAGFIAAFLSGVLACSWMVRLVQKSQLKYFGYYCLALAVFVLLHFYIF
ncbi:MAG TPA: UDP-diphosphatase [Saprospirales bacterium]|nr:UDP-diphosphatase [Saprospirales bacterium]HAY72080.1 UDP-diphosphatase [Saprospirales bacterium]HRQ30040.1 undecaprenyl-diphosphate phosphatase [Saprospiraceae bacterium]